LGGKWGEEKTPKDSYANGPNQFGVERGLGAKDQPGRCQQEEEATESLKEKPKEYEGRRKKKVPRTFGGPDTKKT